MNIKKKYKKLYKIYLYKLHAETENSLKHFNINYLITYLKYVRDSYILNLNIQDRTAILDTKLISITTALNAYDKYKASKSKADRATYWKYFWDLVKVNIEGWEAQ